MDLIQVASEAISKVFHLLATEGVYRIRKINISSSDFRSNDASEILTKWLDSVYEKYSKRSFELLNMKELESVGFNSVMQLIRLSAAGVTEEYSFPVDILRDLIENIISKNDKETDLFELLD